VKRPQYRPPRIVSEDLRARTLLTSVTELLGTRRFRLALFVGAFVGALAAQHFDMPLGLLGWVFFGLGPTPAPGTIP
jgi:hypothetical protein